MKKFLAVVLAVIILILFPIVLISTVTVYSLLNPTSLQQIIRASAVGENLPSVVAAYMEKNQEETTGEEKELSLDTTTISKFVSAAFTPTTVYGLTDTIIDAADQWWESDKPIEQAELHLDLGNVKRQLVPAINEHFGQFTQDVPVCDPNTAPLNPTNLADAGLDFSTMFSMTCLPIDPTTGIAASFGDTFVRNIPDTVKLQDILQQDTIAAGGAEQLDLINQQIDQYRLYWKWLHWVIWIGWGMIGLFLLLIILLRLRPGFAPFGWLGWLHVFMTIEIAPIVIVVWFAPQFILPWITGTFDTAIVEIINNAVTALLAVYLWPLIWVMVGTATASIIWFIIRALVKHHHKA